MIVSDSGVFVTLSSLPWQSRSDLTLVHGRVPFVLIELQISDSVSRQMFSPVLVSASSILR